MVGTTKKNGQPSRAFRWDDSIGMRDLGVLPGMDWSEARNINDKGQIAGNSGLSGFAGGLAFLWSEAEGMRSVKALLATDRTESGAFALNFHGQVVGYSWNGSTFRPVIFPLAR